MYMYISAINGYIFFFQYKSEPGIATTPGICKQTSTYFVFIPMLSIRDLIPSWKSSFAYFIPSLYDTSKYNRDSCFVFTSFIKSLHSEAFKTDLTFLGIVSNHSVKRSSTPKGK